MTRRRTVAALGATAVAAAAIVAAPTGGTQARWTETKAPTVPALRMGTMAVSATDVPVGSPYPATLKSTLANSSGFGVEYAPTSLSFEPMPNTPTVPNDSTGFTNWNSTGVAYDYTDCGARTAWQIPLQAKNVQPAVYPVTGSRLPLVKSSSKPLCLTVKPAMSDYVRYDQFGGREYLLTTTLNAASVASTWTAPALTWKTRYVVPLPAAQQRADSKVCTTDTASNVSLWWSWPDTATYTKTGYSALNSWEVRARPAGTTQPFLPVVTAPGTDRDQNVDQSEMWTQGYGVGSYDFIIRGYPFSGDKTRYTDSALIYHATMLTKGSAGLTSTWACGAPAATSNPDAGMHGY